MAAAKKTPPRSTTAAKKAVEAANNGVNPAHVLDEAAETADRFSGQLGNLGLAFGGLAVSAASTAFALSKFRQLFKGE